MLLIRVNNSSAISRRSFIKLVALSLGGLAIRPIANARLFPAFPTDDRLGRVNVSKVDVKARTDIDSQTIGTLYEDSVVPWLRELFGKNTFPTNHRWVETQDGYIWSPYLQPVRNVINTPVKILPKANGETGMWVEVSSPNVDLTIDNPPPRAPSLQHRQDFDFCH